MVYTVAGNGTALSIHFCMGDYSGISLDHEESPSCGKCGMDDKEGCCHDQLQIIKFDSPASKSASFNIGSLQNLFHHDREIKPARLNISNRCNALLLGSPVHYSGPPLHLINCNFRI